VIMEMSPSLFMAQKSPADAVPFSAGPATQPNHVAASCDLPNAGRDRKYRRLRPAAENS
jgi:hypothetical protein